MTFEGLEQHLFEDERAGSAAAARAHGVHPFDDPHFQGASVLLVNRNFGCGSSREHAPQALQRSGIRAVVGESFSEIFFGNAADDRPAVRHGVARRRARADGAVERSPKTVIRVDLTDSTVEAEGFSCVVTLPANARDALVTGAWDTTGLLLERYEEVDRPWRRLPYIDGF